jgi:hypothetical protein
MGRYSVMVNIRHYLQENIQGREIYLNFDLEIEEEDIINVTSEENKLAITISTDLRNWQ